MSELFACETCPDGDCVLCQVEQCECECHTYEQIEVNDLPAASEVVEGDKRSSLVPKIFAITGGVGAVLAGTAFTLLTGGPGVLAGGALTSAGMITGSDVVLSI